MALEDYLEPEVGVAVAVTAAVASPGVRRALRRGAVYGLAGVLIAGDALSRFARGVSQGAQQMTAEAQDTAADAEESETPAEREAAPKRSRRASEDKAEEKVNG